MAWIDVEDLRGKLAAALHLAVDDPGIDADSPWQQFLVDSLQSAKDDIVDWLTWRGYTPTQIDSWVRGAELQGDIGLWWTLTKGAGLHNYDQKFIDKLDRRPELADVLVRDAGGIIPLEDDQPAIVGRGKS
jgi:hypothetical protein